MRKTERERERDRERARERKRERERKQHTATHCNTLQHTATHCNTLQHTATHCNTLQHTATHLNRPPVLAQLKVFRRRDKHKFVCISLPEPHDHSSEQILRVRQLIGRECRRQRICGMPLLQFVAVSCCELQCVAVCSSMLQCTNSTGERVIDSEFAACHCCSVLQ